MKQALQYVEIDLPYCANVYGSAPCTAVLGVTGAIKCFNTKKTCQDRAHYVEQGATLRFAVPTDYLPDAIEAFPSIDAISFTPLIISLGENLGQRATLEIRLRDHPDTDTGSGFDKYLADRPYVPAAQGSFFGKLRARQPYLRGQALRWINGYVGQTLAEMEVRHFVIDGFDYSSDGVYTVTASDVLKIADGDRAQAPALSDGYLASDITASATSAVLLPSGVGGDYPASGHVCIGGNEVAAFTRAADTLTLTRGQLGTVASAHKAQDRVQLAKVFVGQDPANILYDLMVNYAGVAAGYIDLAAWQAETSAFLGNVYTATITEPTSVNDLVSEIIEQAALAVWWDDRARQVRMQVLRGIATNATVLRADDGYLRDTLAFAEQPDKRISRVQMFFGQIDPTKPITNTDNYRCSTRYRDGQSEQDYGSPAIKTVFSRWIPSSGRAVADRACTILVGRFKDAPRRAGFAVMRYADIDIALGGGYRIEHPTIQDATGAPAQIPLQVTRLGVDAAGLQAEGEEVLFAAPPLSPTVDDIIIAANEFNINLLSYHDSIYPPAVAGDTVNVTVNAGVTIGSHTTSLPAFDVGTGWAAGVILNAKVLGCIQGAAGSGGSGGLGGAGAAGGAGGVALKVRRAINLDIASGQIWGGAGGGAGDQSKASAGGGGGGAGQDPGAGGTGRAGDGARPGASGTSTAGGAGGGAAAAGGGPGLAGSSSAYGSGGAPGAAIDGISFVTVTAGPGDRRGPQIN